LECFSSSDDPRPLYVLDLTSGTLTEKVPSKEQNFFEISTDAMTLGFQVCCFSSLFFHTTILKRNLDFLLILFSHLLIHLQAKSLSEREHWVALLSNCMTLSCSENELMHQAEAQITAWAYRHSTRLNDHPLQIA